jgi:tripartite-type tricarboxylate transporter receptor subunit TctC
MVMFALGASAAAAQDYPTKPIRFVVPYAPGGNTDVLARLIGQKLTEAWGQQVIIDNRAGAAGTLGAELVARAPADGYTIIMGSFGNIIVANSLYKNLKYEPLKDFAPVVLVSLPPGIMVAHPCRPRENRERADRVCEIRSGQAQLRLARHRRVEPSLFRAFQQRARASSSPTFRIKA